MKEVASPLLHWLWGFGLPGVVSPQQMPQRPLKAGISVPPCEQMGTSCFQV